MFLFSLFSTLLIFCSFIWIGIDIILFWSLNSSFSFTLFSFELSEFSKFSTPIVFSSRSASFSEFWFDSISFKVISSIISLALSFAYFLLLLFWLKKSFILFELSLFLISSFESFISSNSSLICSTSSLSFSSDFLGPSKESFFSLKFSFFSSFSFKGVF